MGTKWGLRSALAIAAVLAMAAHARAQAVDTFHPDADDYVYGVALQPDGKIVVGGGFWHFGCTPGCAPGAPLRYYIARLNTDGSVDPTFNPGTDGPVYGVLVQPDGRILAFGNFHNVGGGTGTQTPRQFIARFNADGSVDGTFDPGPSMNLPPLAMALQRDGKILAGGQFTVAGGDSHYFIVRFNTDGTVDPSFASSANGHIYSLVIQPDGKIVVGGVFTGLGGDFGDTTRRYIGRLNTDGSVDAGFNPGADNYVHGLAVQPDGHILMGGVFLGVGGGTGTIPRNRIARLDANGTVDPAFSPGADGTVISFGLQADGRVFVGGNFHVVDGNTRNGLARLNADGSLDLSFNPGANSIPYAIAIQPDGNVVLGGAFSALGGGTGTTSRWYVGRILNSDAPVQSLTVTDGGVTVTWLRNGTMPDLGRAEFAMSTNGVTYTPIGSAAGVGTPIFGGWRVTGVTLPVNPNLTIRLRGFYQTGQAGSSASMQEWIVPAADFNTVENGDFTLGLSGWVFFATPDQSYIDHNVTNEVLNFYRVPPPPGTTNQAVAFQQTGVPLAANVPLVASFDLGNSSSVRKRISILIQDADFTDLSVCTFWLPANAPLRTYGMNTHTTKAWANLTIGFYAASAGSNGGAYQVDNISVRYAPTGSITETLCHDPLTPAPVGGADSATMLVNGDFASGSVTPGWGLFGQISGSVSGGVFRFTKTGSNPSGVILQITGQAVAAGQLLTAQFDLGNISSERKRVTVIMHDNSFADLSACTFWLAPGQPLSTYIYRTYTTQAWTNATLSVYPATVGTLEETLLDNVTFTRTPSAQITGTECLEPGSNWQTMSPEARSAARAKAAATKPLRSAPSGASAIPDSSRLSPAQPLAADLSSGVMHLERAIDLTTATSARLHVESWLLSASARAEIQVSTDGITWETVSVVEAGDTWTAVDVDLSAFLGEEIQVRFVYVGPAKDGWWLRRFSMAVVLSMGEKPCELLSLETPSSQRAPPAGRRTFRGTRVSAIAA